MAKCSALMVAVAVAALAGACVQSDESSTITAKTPTTTLAPAPKEEPPKLPEEQQWLAVAEDESREPEWRVQHARSIIRIHPESPEAAKAKIILDRMGEPVVPPKWHYVTKADQMSGAKYHTASLTSENTLSFSFPYEGEQHGMLMVRRHPAHGNEIIVAIEEGQILCNSYSSCPIRVAFDNGKPRTLRGTDAADGSSEYVFLPGFASLTRQMAASKEMRVQFDVYQQGSPVLIFDVSGFKPDKLR